MTRITHRNRNTKLTTASGAKAPDSPQRKPGTGRKVGLTLIPGGQIVANSHNARHNRPSETFAQGVSRDGLAWTKSANVPAVYKYQEHGMEESDFIKVWLRGQAGTQVELGKRFGLLQRTVGRIMDSGRPSRKSFQKMMKDDAFAGAYDERFGERRIIAGRASGDYTPAGQPAPWLELHRRFEVALNERQALNLVVALELAKLSGGNLDLEIGNFAAQVMRLVADSIEPKLANELAEKARVMARDAQALAEEAQALVREEQDENAEKKESSVTA